MRVGLLQCDHVRDEYQSISGDYNDMFGALLGGFDWTLVVYDATAGHLPADPHECDGYVISGSAASVYDEEPWIRDLEEFVRQAIGAEVPMFGVCFGLQLMATALGGTVEKSDRGWGVGVHTATIDVASDWMEPGASAVSLIMSHKDQVTEMPEGARVLGSSGHCPNYLVEFSPSSVGVQGHPEFTPAYAGALLAHRRPLLAELTDPAIRSLQSATDSSTVAAWIHKLLSDVQFGRRSRPDG